MRNRPIRIDDLDRLTLGQELLRQGTRELARLRLVRGAHRRTAQRMRRALAVVALAASLLGMPFAGSAEAATPFFGVTLAGVGSDAMPAFADIDGDGDLDAFVGNSDGYTIFFENTGTAAAPAFAAPQTNPFGLAYVGIRAAPEFADMDGDGDLDAFVGNSDGDMIFFENTGTAAAPAFAAAQTNPFGLAGVYSRAAPGLADIDGDGDLDAFAGNGGGNTIFWVNTGTTMAPAFATPQTNPFGLADVGSYAAPELADIDGDGDLDAFIGNAYGNTIFFENTGTSAAPAFAGPLTTPFGLTDVGYLAAPAFADIDGDGNVDAFIGEEDGNTIFFENAGTVFAPAFLMPQTNPFGLADVGSDAAPAFTDIDGDGDLDAFVGNSSGNTIFFENTGTSAAAAFLAPQTNPFSLADVGAYAAPAFADIDGDGDLDAFVGNSAGNAIFFENTGTAAAPAFAAPQTNPFGLADVGNLAAPTFADVDGDGDLDAFIGEELDHTNFFENTGTAAAPAFAAPQINPFGLTDVDLEAAPAFADTDGDGDLDAFIGNSVGNAIFFENTGTTSAPAFAGPQTNPFGLADVGSSAKPAFADIDGDGDLDALVGNSTGNTLFFENTGAIFAPAGKRNPFGLGDVGAYAAPAFADIDGDGDLDAFVGNGAGNAIFFENTGTAAAPAFATPQTNPFGLADVGYDAAPALADIDGDGDFDAFVGENYGNTIFFENTGTAAAPAFAAPQTNPFGLGDVGYDAMPAFADIDGDGDLDAFVGNSNGDTIFFQNVGTAAAPAFAAAQTSPFGLADVGFGAAPALADIDGDGDVDAFIGNTNGDTIFFENMGTAAAPAFAAPQTNPFGLADVGYGAAPAFADIDGDGDLDAFVGEDYGNTIFFKNHAASGPPPTPTPTPSPTPASTPTETPTPTPAPAGCPAVPDPGCMTGFEKGSLLVNEKKAGKEKLVVKLVKGPPLAQSDFGNPLISAGTVYQLCLYDDADALVAELEVDRAGETCGTKPCWKTIGEAPPAGKGFAYKDKALEADGVQAVSFKAGEAGKPNLVVTGKNNAAKGQTSLPVGIAAALASTGSVTVQVQTSDAECLSATLPDVVKQDATQFKAK